MISLLGLGFFANIVFLFLFLVIGLILILFIAKVLFFVLPAAVVAFVVWFITGSIFWAGLAFLIISLFSILKRA